MSHRFRLLINISALAAAMRVGSLVTKIIQSAVRTREKTAAKAEGSSTDSVPRVAQADEGPTPKDAAPGPDAIPPAAQVDAGPARKVEGPAPVVVPAA